MATEADIIHENGAYWVLRERKAYHVCKHNGTHSLTESSYAPTPDGLSIAIARCNYLAAKAAAK